MLWPQPVIGRTFVSGCPLSCELLEQWADDGREHPAIPQGFQSAHAVALEILAGQLGVREPSLSCDTEHAGVGQPIGARRPR